MPSIKNRIRKREEREKENDSQSPLSSKRGEWTKLRAHRQLRLVIRAFIHMSIRSGDFLTDHQAGVVEEVKKGSKYRDINIMASKVQLSVRDAGN